MSRIGKRPVSIPAGIEVKADGAILSFKKGYNIHTFSIKAKIIKSSVQGKIKNYKNRRV